MNSIYKYVNSVGSQNIGLFGGNFEGGYQLQQVPDELASFLEDIKNIKVDNYLEIGAASAALTRVISDLIPVNNIFLADLGIEQTFVERFNINFDNLKCSNKYKFIGNSHSLEFDEWLYSFDRKFDFIIIDGDHSYDGVKQDFELAYKYSSDDCVFVFHDIAQPFHPGVPKFTQELSNDSRVIHYKNYLSSERMPIGIGVYVRNPM